MTILNKFTNEEMEILERDLGWKFDKTDHTKSKEAILDYLRKQEQDYRNYFYDTPKFLGNDRVDRNKDILESYTVAYDKCSKAIRDLIMEIEFIENS